jgi:cytochrome c oxidase cbb3-type subunit 3
MGVDTVYGDEDNYKRLALPSFPEKSGYFHGMKPCPPSQTPPGGAARRYFWRAAPAACLAFAMCLSAQDPGRRASKPASPAPDQEAKRNFQAVCASCHGLDGRGGERGPDLRRAEVAGKSDAELMRILREGRTAAGMPSFKNYGAAKLAALVKYLRALDGRRAAAAIPGDPQRGKALFYGKANCADCHMVGGRGGFFAQELTAYAARREISEIRAAILSPNKDLDPRRGLIVVELADSSTLSGMARNEDNFSLQLQTRDGSFHLLNKRDIRKLTYAGVSPMPSDYSTSLSASEIDNLVSFLLTSSGAAAPVGKAPAGEEEE